MKSLGQLEAVVMQRLWDASEPLSVRTVLEDLQREREIAYTSELLDVVLDSTGDRRAALLHFLGRLDEDTRAELRGALGDAEDGSAR